jgi:hypothetical protein
MIEFLSKTGTASKLLGLDIWLWHKSTEISGSRLHFIRQKQSKKQNSTSVRQL